MSHYVYRNLQETKISKLQLIIALYVVYIWLIVFILTSYTLSSLRLGHFMTKKRLTWHNYQKLLTLDNPSSSYSKKWCVFMPHSVSVA